MDFLHSLTSYLHLFRHPDELLLALGPLGVWGTYGVLAAIIFLETGAMVFFLPGDSLLVTAGLFAATAKVAGLDLLWLNLILIPCAILGDATSYFIGKRTGHALFTRERSRLFRPEHVKAAHDFYEKHGGKAIILARFMPIVRTFVPVVAGVAEMTYKQFATFNIVGGASWVLSMTVLGYTLGVMFPSIVKHIELLAGFIILVSVMPAVVQYLRVRTSSKAAA